MNKSSFRNYEYNYNIVKLRSGLNYTKNIIENIINMVDEFKYDEMLDISKFNHNEYLINDNNILFIENSTLHKLNEINANSFPLLDEPNEIIIEDISKKYNLNNDDYSNYIFLKEFKKLLNFENEKIKININNYINDGINSINLLFNKFNNTLYEQKNKYEYYSIKSINIFKENLMNYYNMIENKFSFKYNELINLENTVHFKNVLRNHLSDLQNKKRIYFKTRINEIGKSYNLHSLNITLNIGEYFEKYIEKSYEDLELDYISEYVEIYENYSKLYINNLVNYFKDYKSRVLNKFSILINEYLKNFQNGISNFVNKNYITELKKNYSNCFGYSIDLLNQTIEEDKINYEKYINYKKLMEYITFNCTNGNFTDNIDNCTYNESEIEEVVYFNKTEYLYFCHKNKYFNYSVIIFENFEENYKNKLKNLINEILETIEKKNLDFNFLNFYLEKELKLNAYSLSENDILGDFEGFEDMIILSNYTYNQNYQDYIKELILDSFHISYNNYINNYLVEKFKENINIYINTKLDFYTKYLIEKISNEFSYYIFLFNKTKEIGIGTVNAFSNLYKKSLYKNLKFYYDEIKEDALFHINIFYRKNKYIFKENYINFFINELNDYNVEIYGLKEYINELIYDINFNKTLNNLSDKLMKELIIKELNKTFINTFNNKINQINIMIENYDRNIFQILSAINKNEDNLNINKIIMSYQEILINQNNKFIFKVGNEPFELLNDFIKNILEPPLIKIKNQYNIIENKILETISNSLNNFPDYTSIFKNQLHVEEILNYIEFLYDTIKDLLLNYGEELDIDTNNYINKLIHYTYIKGLYTYDEPCIYSFCRIDIDYNNANRDLEEKNAIYKKRKLSKNKSRRYEHLKINKNIYLNGLYYNEEMGALSKDDIIYGLIETKNAINQIDRTLQTNFDTKIKSKLEKYLNKVNGTYLFKLKKTISMSALKFSNFLTRDTCKILESQMFKHYYILENYIFNFSNYLKNNTYDLITSIKSSSDYLQDMNAFIYDKILGIHDMLFNLIENKYSRISAEETENYNKYKQESALKKKNNITDFDNTLRDDFIDLFEEMKEENYKISKNIFGVSLQVKVKIFGEVKYNFIKAGEKK